MYICFKNPHLEKKYTKKEQKNREKVITPHYLLPLVFLLCAFFDFIIHIHIVHKFICVKCLYER